MSAKILMGPEASPPDVWKGYAAVDRAGVELAVEMLDELENDSSDDDEATTSDHCCLEDWPRQGGPFRNIVAEYLQRARAGGANVEAGFCAVLSDYVALVSSGSVPTACNYYKMFEIE